jgi:hypothetical protein
VAGIIWKSKTPLKIKFFLWQIANNKLQVAANLAKKRVERAFAVLSM